jgi:hypothetical protein
MPLPITRIDSPNITRVNLKEAGWVSIVPGSFVFTALEFWDPTLPDGQQFTELSYLGYKFVEVESGKLYAVSSDGILAMEYFVTPAPEPEPDPEPEPEPGEGEV